VEESAQLKQSLAELDLKRAHLKANRRHGMGGAANTATYFATVSYSDCRFKQRALAPASSRRLDATTVPFSDCCFKQWDLAPASSRQVTGSPRSCLTQMLLGR
jgi:hypothetical protein